MLIPEIIFFKWVLPSLVRIALKFILYLGIALAAAAIVMSLIFSADALPWTDFVLSLKSKVAVFW